MRYGFVTGQPSAFVADVGYHPNELGTLVYYEQGIALFSGPFNIPNVHPSVYFVQSEDGAAAEIASRATYWAKAKDAVRSNADLRLWLKGRIQAGKLPVKRNSQGQIVAVLFPSFAGVSPTGAFLEEEDVETAPAIGELE